MGYYTDYTISIAHGDSYDIEEIKQRIEEESDYYFVIQGRKESGRYICSEEPIKWYDADDHMKKISKEYPDLVFELHGIGEDHQQWVDYFHNGEHA